MANFDYLKDIREMQSIYPDCRDAEQFQLVAPDKSVTAARRALEKWVKIVYLINDWRIPERASLLELTSFFLFQEYVGLDMMKRIDYIRKRGNIGAHGGTVKKSESFFTVLNLYEVISSFLQSMHVVEDYAPFDKTLIPTTVMLTAVSVGGDELIQNDDLNRLSQVAPAPITIKTSPDAPSEAETRRLYIDMMLREAGWEVQEKEGAIVPGTACVEIEVKGMPSESGVGYADYVLFGTDGKPLAVVEAKKTTVDPLIGKHQAELYAYCLEQRYGVRPVVYYTNGFETWVIDGLGYPPRPLYSFHTASNLELLIQKRNRQNITDLRVNPDIAGRAYQIQAIHSIVERLNKKMRRGLLVMATGTGKTRVSIALVELLMRNNWVKNVLFLADRTALVKQAWRNYTKLLPSVSTCVLSDDRNPDMDARILFSTYQTMIHYIDSEKKPFSIGRFDLIIIDEAHRSCYGRYESIFDYFDDLLVGLTATPREDIEHDTYSLLNTDSEDVFAYELEDAVEEHHLVGYNVLQRQSIIMTQGVKYDDLSPQEKQHLETAWAYEKAKLALDPRSEYARDIDAKEIFQVFYNQDTIDKVLEDLMENGLRVNDGDTIGKTIIFAYRHKHAEMIVERFNALYPQYGPDFCTLIDNQVKYGQDLIDNFSAAPQDQKKKIQIAVSVDMLDTGVDVPDVLNLVFFKQVRSKVKFMQMIGRGTRLCPNIFGAGKDKEQFYIFDHCGNFEYFGSQPNGSEPRRSASLTERLFAIKLRIATILQDVKYQEDPFAKALHDRLKDELRMQVETLEDTRTAVRKHWQIVSQFKQAKAWEYISDIQRVSLEQEVAPLLITPPVDEMARKWDLLNFMEELSMLDDTVNGLKPAAKIQTIAQQLEKKASIPEVLSKIETIRLLQTPAFWENKTLQSAEYVRQELRDIVHYIAGEQGKTFVIDIEDVLTPVDSDAPVSMQATYRQKVMDYLQAHLEDDTVLQKIFHLEPLTNDDIRELEQIFWKELGTKEDYEHTYLRQERYKLYGGNIAAFIRSIIGIDREIALQKFIDLIQTSALTTMQSEYLKKILDYVSVNGDITTDTFAEEPFSNMDWLDTFGAQTICVRDYIQQLHGIISYQGIV